MSKEVFDFTMGADPEFAVSKGKYGDMLIQAIEEVKDPGLDSFGCDGCDALFEVRPDYSTDPLELVHNIRQVMIHEVLQGNKISKLHWFAGSFYQEKQNKKNEYDYHPYGYPLGGHIHFGIKSQHWIGFNSMCSLLSHYVGVCSILIEKTIEAKKRRLNGYGGMLDHREQDYGFEYRTPSSWLTSPYIAAAILCLAKAVMFEKMNNRKFKPPHTICGDDIRHVNVVMFRKMFPEIWRSITSLRLYPLYRPYIDLLHFLITNKLTWYPAVSMKEAWGLPYMGSPTPRAMTLEQIWTPFLAQLES